MGVCWSGKVNKNYKIESKNKNKLDLTHLENNNNLFSDRKNKANFICFSRPTNTHLIIFFLINYF